MDESLTVQMVIPIGDSDWGGPCITFFQWIPDGQTFQLERVNDDTTVRLWLDRSCVSVLGEVDDNLLNNWANIQISKMFVEVETIIPTKLATFIYDEREAPQQIHHGADPSSEDYAALNQSYYEIGEKVLRVALETYNRLIAYARNYKGQYWLQERSIELDRMSSLNNEFRAKARTANSNWFRWCPPATDTLVVFMQPDEIPIHKDDWDKVRDFVVSNSRPDFILQLLANAEFYLAAGYRRSAVVESITALEMAVARFAASPKLAELIGQNQISRVNVIGLKSQVDHMGLSGTVGYLLPVLFPETILPTGTIAKCQEAIEVRNTIVHKGQRDVEEGRARSLVKAVRSTCQIISDYTS